MPRERSSSATSDEDGYVVIRPHSLNPSNKVTGNSPSLSFTEESTLPAGTTAPSAPTERSSKPPERIGQKPMLHAAICESGLAVPSAVYTYTYKGEGTFPLPDRLGQWPMLELERFNAGESERDNIARFTQTFRHELSYILHGNISSLTVEDLKRYELVLSDEDQKVHAKHWVADALHTITACPGILHKEEGREPSELLAYIKDLNKKTGECARAHTYHPTVAGYLTDAQDNFICFVSDGGPW